MAAETHKELLNCNELMGNWFRKDVQYSQFQVWIPITVNAFYKKEAIKCLKNCQRTNALSIRTLGTFDYSISLVKYSAGDVEAVAQLWETLLSYTKGH